MHTIGQKITVAGALTLFKCTVIGFSIGEIAYDSQVVGARLYQVIQGRDLLEQGALIIFVSSLVLLAVYFLARNGIAELQKLCRSHRIDLLVMLLLGLTISVLFGGIAPHKLRELISHVGSLQILSLVCVPLAMGLLLIGRATLLHRNELNEKPFPFFIADAEQRSKEDDLLELSGDATRFAERVLNGGAADSVVFGIDAPWGIGKSSFVNFCIEYWEQTQKDRVIVYKFNLLRYDDRSDFLERFVDGLVNTIDVPLPASMESHTCREGAI